MATATFLATWHEKIVAAADQAIFRIAEKGIGDISARLAHELVYGPDEAYIDFLDKSVDLNARPPHVDLTTYELNWSPALERFRAKCMVAREKAAASGERAIKIVNAYQEIGEAMLQQAHDIVTAYIELLSEVKDVAERYPNIVPRNVHKSIEQKFHALQNLA